MLETFSDLAELEQALRAVRSRCDLPVIAQVTVGEGRCHRIRGDGGTGGQRGGGMGRRCRRPQLLGRTGGHPGRTGKDGPHHPVATHGPAQRRSAAGHRRPQDLRHGTRVHGPVRAPHNRGRRPDRGRLLRHHTGTHPPHPGRGRRDPAPHRVRARTSHGGRVCRAQAREAAAAALRSGPPPRRGRVRHLGQGSTAKGMGDHAARKGLSRPRRGGRGRDRCPRRPRRRPAERARHGRGHREVVPWWSPWSTIPAGTGRSSA